MRTEVLQSLKLHYGICQKTYAKLRFKIHFLISALLYDSN